MEILGIIYLILSSPIATPLIAIVTIASTFAIYYVRRRYAKKDAALIILLEMQNADANIDEARKVYEAAKANNPSTIVFPEKLRLMKTESWTKYKYLFVRDFTDQQWQEIGKFYNNCINFDTAVEHRDSNFFRNEAAIRESIQNTVGLYSREFAEEAKDNPESTPTIERENAKLLESKLRKKNIAVSTNISALLELYNPDKSFHDAVYYFSLLPHNIENTPIGQKLRRLSGRDRRFTFHKR